MPKFRRKLVRHNNGENNTSNSNLIDNINNNNNNNGSDIDFNFVNNAMNDNKSNTFKQEQNLLTTACRTKYVTVCGHCYKTIKYKD